MPAVRCQRRAWFSGAPVKEEFLAAVLGIRDILVRIRIAGSPDPYLWLMIRIRIQLRIRLLFSLAKQKIFSYFFLITCPQAHYLQSKKFNFCLKFCVKILFCRHSFSPLNTFMKKGKDPESDPGPDPYIWLMDPDPVRPKTSGSCGSGSGSPTLPGGVGVL